jgi:hypothetical protein
MHIMFALMILGETQILGHVSNSLSLRPNCRQWSLLYRMLVCCRLSQISVGRFALNRFIASGCIAHCTIRHFLLSGHLHKIEIQKNPDPRMTGGSAFKPA